MGKNGSYAFKTKPYRHQRQALKRLLKSDFGGALLFEPRTGKSKTTIDYASILNQLGIIDRMVIICPSRIMGTWAAEFHNHCPRMFNLTIWDAEARKQPLPPVRGTYQLEVVIVNFEAFSQVGKKTKSGRVSKASGRYKNRSMLLKWMQGGKTLGVVDESHKIKSPSGKAANMIVSMRDKFERRLILTGTPLTKAKRAFDIWMQWQFLNPERFNDLPTLKEFKAHYGRWQDVPLKDKDRFGRERTYPKYLGPRNVKELQQRMGEDAIIVLREDCFDLPPREDIVEYVKLGPSRGPYEQMAAEMIALLEDGDEVEASIKLTQALRLSQITSGFAPNEDGDIKRIGFEKADKLREILEDQFEKEQKVVVAARWKPDLDLIEDIGKDIGFKVWSIRGNVKRADSDNAIWNFRDYDGPAVMVIQPQAASMGIDLSTASLMVWYGHVNSWVDFTQACDRIALSRTSTTFIHLVAEDTIDEVIMATLANDGDVAKELMAHPDRLLKGQFLKTDNEGRISFKSR